MPILGSNRRLTAHRLTRCQYTVAKPESPGDACSYRYYACYPYVSNSTKHIYVPCALLLVRTVGAMLQHAPIVPHGSRANNTKQNDLNTKVGGDNTAGIGMLASDLLSQMSNFLISAPAASFTTVGVGVSAGMSPSEVNWLRKASALRVAVAIA